MATAARNFDMASARPSWAGRLHDLCAAIDARPHLVLPFAIALYLAVFVPVAQRPLWYDEISTFHVAKSPTLGHFIACLTSVELSPPLQFVFVRLSMALFGESPLAVRLPSLLAFLAGSLILFRIAWQRFGGGVALATLGLFWAMAPGAMAVEARPYGLLMGFFAAALYCWLAAQNEIRWSHWHAGLLLSITAMFLTHCFSPFYAMAIGIGELVRIWQRKRLDWPVWLAILAPLTVLPSYLPLLRTAKSVVFPDALQVTALTPVMFYIGMLTPVALAAILILIFGIRGAGKTLPAPLWTFAIAALTGPFLIMAYSAVSRVPFWNRYGSPAGVAMALVLAALLAKWANGRPAISVSVSAVVFTLFAVTQAGTPALMAPFEGTNTGYRQIEPSLPLVTASGLSFLEMDLREPETVARRVVYLTDREAAIRYRQFTIFEGLADVQKVFPLRAKVAAYRDFTRDTRRFLVLTRPESMDDWLLDQARADGAKPQLLWDKKTPYRDHQLYEVHLP